MRSPLLGAQLTVLIFVCYPPHPFLLDCCPFLAPPPLALAGSTLCVGVG